MPRLRPIDVKHTGDASTFPAEFASDDAPVWQTGDAARQWFADRGLKVTDAVKWGPRGRRRAAITAWCEAEDVSVHELVRLGVNLGASNLGRLHWIQLVFGMESAWLSDWSQSKWRSLNEMDVEDLERLLRHIISSQ